MSDNHEQVLGQIDQDETISLLQELVRDPDSVNPPGDVTKSVRIAREKLEAEGFECDTIGDLDHVPNLIARCRFGDGPSLLYNAHVDVVPVGDESAWEFPPFDATIARGRVYGRGSGDDKASVAAQIMGAIAAKRSGLDLAGEIVVNVCGDEETGGRHGAKYTVDHIDPKPDFVVAGEQTLNRVCVGERGGAGVTVTVIGKTAHAALPWNGVHAIEGAAEIIAALRRELWPKLAARRHPLFDPPSTATVSIIDGGVKTNVVPDRCTFHVDRRILPGETSEGAAEEIQAIAERTVAQFPGMKVEVSGRVGGRATLLDVDSAVVHAMSAANSALGIAPEPVGYNMATDGRHFAAAGIPTIIYGPGDPSLAHVPNEWVGIDEVMEATRAYALCAIEMFTNGS
ncbi:MAG: M20 family metallopeptidase [Thermomicrobiales bacterium]